MESINVEILCVGTEILLGNIVNSNSKVISEELHNIGVNVYHHSVVGDNLDRAVEALENGFKHSNVIITTGGLGPTKDDMTKEAVSKYFDAPQVLYEEEKEKLVNFFKNRNIEMPQSNLRQVHFPVGSIALDNPNGTAPGLILEKDGKTVIMLPGPPHEMKPMLANHVIPYLQKRSNKVFYSKTLNFIGIGESALEERLEKLIDAQTNPTIAPYAKIGYPILRVTASSSDLETSMQMVEKTADEIKMLASEHLFGYNEEEPQHAIVRMLSEQNLTISFAESCTGGMVASNIVDVNNSSKVFKESFVTYSNEAKVQRLGVKPSTLESFGAVSRECAIEMAKGVRAVTNSDIGVSITGIAGDSGGTAEKPLGLTYICIDTKDTTFVKEFIFSRKRNDNRRNATINAFNIIIKYLKGYNLNNLNE